jgi:glutamate formiminotransferase/formiminotetrahydrofolate cyclodeaminase
VPFATYVLHCPQVIDEIAAAIRDTAGCTLLDVDPGISTNRTVYTFVGEPAAVVRGAFNAARIARRLINMAAHRGEGAVFNGILALLTVSD